MNILAYNIKIALAVKSLRELRRVKQHVIAEALNMTQANYCRMEQGKIPITVGQLKVIAKELNTSVFQILAIVDNEEIVNFKYESLSEILIKFVLMTENSVDAKKIISENELEYIINKIRKHYETLN